MNAHFNMKIIVGTKFKSKKTEEEYIVVKREISPIGVKIDFMDKNKKLFKNADEDSILKKIETGDLYDLTLIDPWKNKLEYHFFGETRSILMKFFE